MRKALNILMFTIGSLSAQDIHFTQFHAMPMNLNPAMTGFFNGDLRVGGIYRNQWFTVKSPSVGTTYQTGGGFIDASILKRKLKGSFLGVGISAFYDKAGDLGLGTIDATVNLAYSQRFGRRTKHSIAIGLQGELISKGFTGLANAQFSDGLSDNASRQFTGFDAGVGLRYHLELRKRLNMYFGAAYTHILQPAETYLENGGQKIEPKITASAGALIDLNDQFNLLPSFMFLMQGPAFQTNVGTYAQFVIGEAGYSKNAISFGFFTRFARPIADAFIVALRLDYAGLQVGASYDFNVSDLRRASMGQGAAEIHAMYIINFKQKGRHDVVFCPRF